MQLKIILLSLVKGLASDDKHTCILSSKALCLASESETIDYNNLFTIHDALTTKIMEVSTYLKTAFTNFLKNSQNEGQQIQESHIMALPEIYEKDQLEIEDVNYKDAINKNILEILATLAKTIKF